MQLLQIFASLYSVIPLFLTGPGTDFDLHPKSVEDGSRTAAFTTSNSPRSWRGFRQSERKRAIDHEAQRRWAAKQKEQDITEGKESQCFREAKQTAHHRATQARHRAEMGPTYGDEDFLQAMEREESRVRNARYRAEQMQQNGDKYRKGDRVKQARWRAKQIRTNPDKYHRPERERQQWSATAKKQIGGAGHGEEKRGCPWKEQRSEQVEKHQQPEASKTNPSTVKSGSRTRKGQDSLGSPFDSVPRLWRRARTEDEKREANRQAQARYRAARRKVKPEEAQIEADRIIRKEKRRETVRAAAARWRQKQKQVNLDRYRQVNLERARRHQASLKSRKATGAEDRKAVAQKNVGKRRVRPGDHELPGQKQHEQKQIHAPAEI